MSMYFNKNNKGFSLIEVMVTLVILMTGLLGLAGLQGKAYTSQAESYQRSQALTLLKDMASRLNANRSNSSSYKTTSPLGVGSGTCTSTNTITTDLCEWDSALKGSAEGTTAGAMVGARGCITELASTLPKKYLIAVVWQGLTPTTASAVTCGQNSYGSNDALRRVMTIPVTIAKLN